ncbi:outer membrane lipoprotein chaperone LolA [Sessilibacter sp. MAH4]
MKHTQTWLVATFTLLTSGAMVVAQESQVAQNPQVAQNLTIVQEANVAAVDVDQNLISSLKALLTPLANSKGKFEQSLYDQTGQLIQDSSGNYALKQPGKFRWDTLEPFPQVLVSNGETIWLYDPDLDQVTIKPFSAQADQLPIRIISGDYSVLENEFDVRLNTKPSSNGEQTFVLTPKTSGQILRVELRFGANNIESMSVVESGNTRTEFVFKNTQPLSGKEPTSFEFIVPENADVFYDN